MLRHVIWMGLSLCGSTLLAAEPPLTAERLAKLEAGWQQAIKDLS